MGAYLDHPTTEKHSDNGLENVDKYQYAVSEMQGWRKSMEDAYTIQINLTSEDDNVGPVHLFGVFDGHGGQEVAWFCSKHLGSVLKKLPAFQQGDFVEALTQAFYRIDEMLRDESHAGELSSMKATENDVENDHDEAIKVLEPPFEAGSSESELRIDVSLTELELTEKLIETENHDVELHETSEGDVETSKTPADGISECNTLSEEQDFPRDSVNSLRSKIKNQMKAAEEKGRLSKCEAVDLVVKMLKLKKMEDGSPDESSGEGEEASEFLFTEAGCTAIVALVHGNKLYVANAGDSRCVLCRDGSALGLSDDHKPFKPVEYSRIRAAGGYVTDAGRVNGNLNLSRSIGDLKYKSIKTLPPAEQIITSKPDVTVTELTEQDHYFILACDGIFDVLENEELIELMNKNIGTLGVGPLSLAVERLFDDCICDDPNTSNGIGADNMTSMVVLLKPLKFLMETHAASISTHDDT